MERPRVWTRLQAAAHGEVSAETLEIYRNAGLAVLDLMERVEADRECARALGETAWTLPSAEASRFVAAWNAYALHRLGSALLDADYRGDHRTIGFVPPVVAGLVLDLFRPVEMWLGRAQRAGSDPNYRLDVPLPATLPDLEGGPIPSEAHLRGLLEAMRALRDRACTALDLLGPAPPKDEAGARQYHAIRGVFASVEATARYAEDLVGPHPARSAHRLIAPTVREAIAGFHRVGQLAAMPRLADGPAPRPTSSSPSLGWMPPVPHTKHRTGLALPGEPGFDPWCLTDSIARRALERDPEARRAIDLLWRYDPEPEATLSLLESIRAAERRGDIGRAMGFHDRPVGHFYLCPWGTVYVTHRAQRIGDHWLGAHQQFVLDATAEGAEQGRPFRRGLKIGEFERATEVEYGDPTTPPNR